MAEYVLKDFIQNSPTVVERVLAGYLVTLRTVGYESKQHMT